ncbi:putative toxin-antitoxin system toxin component, PIN family [Antarcticibacterium flavum]|uniref:Putative toxin-antitoxin system toxin component, PIN family n=1 Tax=Antarcticibacterium flavum TaxID=2058175 RepID=A0A5B7X5E0_9FLAO|nr:MULTISPECIES: putative toxin-antitoxin system toxin component, PIN family [Antarcticibacterium]MCM4161376.1 putative toxin-antitoxin system toxin component, PIN family [Antarcticibacterium sp. W02-3]QCY70597.1 putative toxin-antitoxin system toxin component, PIN family [Antarcticibacterium flavum]
MKNKRVILDTNLWISYLITNSFTEIDEFIQDGIIILVFSEELLDEFIEVAKRPKLRKFFATKDVESLLTTFNEFAELIAIESQIDVCRDKKDNFLLNLAIDGKADYLVTGDKDLLVLKKIDKTHILTYRELVEKLKGNS